MKKKISMWLFLLCPLLIADAFAQAVKVKGQVKDELGQPIPDVTVARLDKDLIRVKTDAQGLFTITVDKFPAKLKLTYVGKKMLILDVKNQDFLDAVMQPESDLDALVVTGSRSVARSVLTSAVPIDNIGIKSLEETGQISMEKMLAYKIPSYNSTQQFISDATAAFDPSELRGVGPSRTLVLINGKRKNPSALVYINDTPGKGEIGVDMQSIPSSAISRIEVLRDGASAQYGSDAIGGVINIVLKDNVNQHSLDAFSGLTEQGDGFNLGAKLNTGFKVSKAKITLSADLVKQYETNRAASPGEDRLFGEKPPGKYDYFFKEMPDLGMRIGLPNSLMADIMANISVPVFDKAELYAFGGATHRKVRSYALYRTPYWVEDPNNLLHAPGTTYYGFQPTFEPTILDHTAVIGLKGEALKWNYDVSLTRGGNKIDYQVNNTINPDLGKDSPTQFNVGGYTFGNLVANLDLSRSFGKLSVSAGSEFRNEQFVAKAGIPASYFGKGASSFPGIQPSNEVSASRNNVGVYTGAAYDFTKSFMIDASVRYENYQDFGDNFSWKISSRYKTNDNKFVIRGSASTGFRAPGLQQIYLSNIQTHVSAGSISNQGTFSNGSDVVKSLGVAPLTRELSFSYTGGITLQPVSKLSLSLDYYRIRIDNRVVYSSSIEPSKDASNKAYNDIFANNGGITSLKFFTNAVNTVTNGVDIVASYRDIKIGKGKIDVSVAANFNKTIIVGDIKTPEILTKSGAVLFDRAEQGRITEARPKDKVILGINYDLKKFSAVLNNTHFGAVSYQDVNPKFDQTFSPKVITDLSFGYKINKNISVKILINNLLDVYPDRVDSKGNAGVDLGGRMPYSWHVQQFGFAGRMYMLGLNFKM